MSRLFKKLLDLRLTRKMCSQGSEFVFLEENQEMGTCSLTAGIGTCHTEGHSQETKAHANFLEKS